MIHRFDDPLPLDGAAAARWLGGKGASLAQMTQMGLPVPPGFTLSTRVWRHYDREGELPDGLEDDIRASVAELEEKVGASFGGPFVSGAGVSGPGPLLLAVRSGGATSMPGQLETVLDVGITDAAGAALEATHGSPRFVRDVRRRFVESYASAVLGVPKAAFDALLARRDPTDMDAPQLGRLLSEMEALVRHESGTTIPEDPWRQLFEAVRGVLRSWRLPRAERYRRSHGIGDDEGSGVTIQAMVFGNLSERSGSGVVFSRNPSTGQRVLFGEWLGRAQGEDVVSGRHTPWPLTRAQVRRGREDRSLESAMPEAFDELRRLCGQLEVRYGDAVDVEVTIERGRVYALQCRSAKRAAVAAARMAVEMHREGTLDRRQALARVDAGSLRQLLTPRLPDPEVLAAGGLTPMARGLAASPGAATGRVVMDQAAVDRLGRQDDLILVRADTSAEDVEAMRIVQGVLTSAGGLTSHGAVVARALGKPCVTGATSLHVDYRARQLLVRASGEVLSEGDLVTIDGTRGLVYASAVAVEPAPASEHVQTILDWADEARHARIFAEAGTVRLATIGRRFGSDGVAVMSAAHDGWGALVEAAGEGSVFARISDEHALRQALPILRDERDHVLVPPELIALARELLGARSLRLWGEGAGASGRWVSTPEEIGDLPPGVGVAFRADETSRAMLEAAQAAARDVLLVVPPLDVAVGRLFAGQTPGRNTQAPRA